MPGSRSSAHAGNTPADRNPTADTEPVGLTVHALPTPDVAALEKRTRAGRWRMALVLAVCAAPVVASYFTYYVIRPQGRTNYASLIQPTRAMPAQLPLRTLGGEALQPSALHQQWLLTVVATSGCDAACEKRLLLQRQLHQMLGRERDRVEKLLLVVDDAPLPAALVEGLTKGDDPARVLRVPREALARWFEPATGQALEDHVYIVDPMGEWMMRAPVDPEPQKLKRDLDRLLRASSGWDKAGR